MSGFEYKLAINYDLGTDISNMTLLKFTFSAYLTTSEVDGP